MPRFSPIFQGTAFRILILGKVSRGRSGPATVHPTPGRLPDSLFGEREPTQELTLRAFVREIDFTGPTLASFCQNFGFWPLLGKSVAIVSDARRPLNDVSRLVAPMSSMV